MRNTPYLHLIEGIEHPDLCFFYFVFNPLEVSEHFVLLPHGVDPGVLGEVVDKDHVISVSAECSRLSRSPYIGVNYI